MGQKQSTAVQFSDNSLKTFQQNYLFVKEINDERWGIAQIFKEKGGLHEVMVVSKNLHTDTEYKEFIHEVQLRAESPNPSLVRLIGWRQENADGLCGHNRKIDLYCDYLSQNLQKEINRRTEKKEPFEESELWYLLRVCLSVGYDFQLRGMHHGDYRPHQILLTEADNSEGVIHLTDNGLLGLFRNNYVMTLSGSAKGYLTPELMAHYFKKESNPAYNVYKADVFSLGMTLLYAATLRDPHYTYYDWPAHVVNTRQIQKDLNELQNLYSPSLASVLSLMLDENEITRPDFLGLSGYVNQGGVRVVQAPVAVPQVLTSSPVRMQQLPVQAAPILSPVQPSPVISNIGYSHVSGPQVIQPPIGHSIVQPPVQVQAAPISHSIIQPQALPPQGISYSGYGQPLGMSVGGYALPPQSLYQPPAGYGSYQGIKYVAQASPVRGGQVSDLSDLDRRVEEAIRTTEETISRNQQASNLAGEGASAEKVEGSN